MSSRGRQIELTEMFEHHYTIFGVLAFNIVCMSLLSRPPKRFGMEGLAWTLLSSGVGKWLA